jgi:hypothetical protein
MLMITQGDSLGRSARKIGQRRRSGPGRVPRGIQLRVSVSGWGCVLIFGLLIPNSRLLHCRNKGASGHVDENTRKQFGTLRNRNRRGARSRRKVIGWLCAFGGAGWVLGVGDWGWGRLGSPGVGAGIADIKDEGITPEVIETTRGHFVFWVSGGWIGQRQFPLGPGSAADDKRSVGARLQRMRNESITPELAEKTGPACKHHVNGDLRECRSPARIRW